MIGLVTAVLRTKCSTVTRALKSDEVVKYGKMASVGGHDFCRHCECPKSIKLKSVRKESI